MIKSEVEIMPSSPLSVRIAAVVAILFGGLTLFSGGSVLFLDGQSRVEAGNYVPWIVWFNFLAGFAYILAGVRLFLWHGCAIKLSMVIFVATLLASMALGIHILLDGAYEMRTVGAMALRSSVWLTIALVALSAWHKRSEAE